MNEEDRKALEAETALRVERDAERLITQWSTEKVRVYNTRYDLWWCWYSSGYTKDITKAGLYDKGFKVPRPCDEIRPVDPTKYEFDAIMSRLKPVGQ
jgi:hypothetical protein